MLSAVNSREALETCKGGSSGQTPLGLRDVVLRNQSRAPMTLEYTMLTEQNEELDNQQFSTYNCPSMVRKPLVWHVGGRCARVIK